MIRWRSLLQAPRARLLEAPGAQATLVQVDGLLCEGRCVVRVRESLAALPGVRSISHIAGTDRFLVDAGERLSEAQVDAAVQRVVVLRPLRRALAALAKSRSRRTPRREATASD